MAAYPQDRMDQIAQFKWYFEHASVGGNMMDGIADLNTGNPTKYRVVHAGAGATPPGATSTGVINDYDRGNPGWRRRSRASRRT